MYRGIGLAHFKLMLRLYTTEDWNAWHEWKSVVQRAPLGERPRALEIEHPQLADLGITSVVVEDVLQPVQTGDGEWTIEVKLAEFRRPEFTLTRPEGSQDRPTDPVDQYIEQLSGQVQELAG